MSDAAATPVGSDAPDAVYWDAVYRQGETTRSWYEDRPTESLQMFADAGVAASASVVDVGGGASSLVDALLHQGYPDVTVLDLSADGMGAAQRRLGPAASAANWVAADLTTWRPPRRYDVWHDRALLHFFTTAAQQAAYLRVLDEATHAGSLAVIGTFAADGPDQCSGLTVARHDPRGSWRCSVITGSHWRSDGTSTSLRAGRSRPSPGSPRVDRKVTSDAGLAPPSAEAGWCWLCPPHLRAR